MPSQGPHVLLGPETPNVNVLVVPASQYAPLCIVEPHAQYLVAVVLVFEWVARVVDHGAELGEDGGTEHRILGGRLFLGDLPDRNFAIVAATEEELRVCEYALNASNGVRMAEAFLAFQSDA